MTRKNKTRSTGNCILDYMLSHNVPLNQFSNGAVDGLARMRVSLAQRNR